MKSPLHGQAAGLAGIILGLVAASASAQIINPLAVGNITPVTDVLGQILPGNEVDPDPCLVVIHKAGPAGLIVPPDPVTGAADTNVNPWVRTSHIGHGAIGPRSGLFSEIFNNRLEGGVQYFARVFDRATADAALYYADSALFSEPSGDTCQVDFGPMRLVSGEDDLDSDGDGLPDAIENEVTGTSPSRKDTDGDGYSDHFEWQHDAYLSINDTENPDPREIRVEVAEPSGDAQASWWAIPGVSYRLEFTDALLVPEAFVEVWSGTASETNQTVPVEDVIATNSPKGFFRWTIP